MSEPPYIPCRNSEHLPSAGEIAELATRERHVVLLFAFDSAAGRDAFDASAVLDRLRPQLPEDVSAFDAGGTRDDRRLTFKRVIATAVVLENEDAILAAAREFGAVATRLMLDLCGKLGLSPEEFKDPLVRFRLCDRANGTIPGGWSYVFHGLECRFVNNGSGQVVDVRLGFGAEFGALDPWFFHQFLTTTPAFASVAALFPDRFHDPARAFDVLEQCGGMRRITRTLGGRYGVIPTR